MVGISSILVVFFLSIITVASKSSFSRSSRVSTRIKLILLLLWDCVCLLSMILVFMNLLRLSMMSIGVFCLFFVSAFRASVGYGAVIRY